MITAWIAGLLLAGPAVEDEAERLPQTLSSVELAPLFEEGPAQEPEKGQKDRAAFSIGPMAGYLKARDADRGTWFGGVNARLRFARIFAIEGTISVHTDSFQDGDIDIVQYPVQVSALLFPIPDSPVEPYGVFGAGWYYTKIDYDGALSGLDNETDRDFAFHAGGGVQVEVGPRFALFADFRWVFMDEPGVDNGNLDEEEFDFGMVTLGGSFSF